MLKKINLFILILLSVAIISGCSDDGNGSEYVDVDEYNEKVKNISDVLNIDTSGYKYDDSGVTLVSHGFTFNDKFTFINLQKNKVNLSNGRVQSICDVPGCLHNINYSENCLEKIDMQSPKATKDGIYFISENKFFLRQSGKDKLIFENTYYTEYEEEAYPEEVKGDNTKCLLSSILLKDDTVYVFAPSYFYEYDINTGNMSEPIQIFDSENASVIMSVDVENGCIFMSNENLELFSYNIETKKLEKITDKVGIMQSKNGKLYYTKWNETAKSSDICSYDLKDKNETKISENCQTNFCLTDKSIYYQTADDNEHILKSDLDGKNTEKIKLEYTFDDGKKFEPTDPHYNLWTC
ncbi:MAG: DUF5050 domain-containing protein, partial [Ruminococcus sp.]|nr:DUF5050 domain-containing protein [Ruminococcus sp.]